MIKKAVSFILIFSFAFTFAACGSGNVKTSTYFDTVISETEEKKHIATPTDTTTELEITSSIETTTSATLMATATTSLPTTTSTTLRTTTSTTLRATTSTTLPARTVTGVPNEKVKTMEEYLSMTVGEVIDIFGDDYICESYIDMFTKYLYYDNGATPLKFWFDIPYYVDDSDASSYPIDNLRIYRVDIRPDDSSKTYTVADNFNSTATYSFLLSQGGEYYGYDEIEERYALDIETSRGSQCVYLYDNRPGSNSVADEIRISNYN